MGTLLIIESPGKRKKLESILGPGYTVKASFGHVRDLPEKEIGVSAPDYKPRYVVSDARSKKTVAELRRAAQSCERVLLATDPDREGEAIAWHVAEALGLSTRERISYQSITEKAVKAAVSAPRAIDMNLVRAQEARRVLDRLVGYEVSPALSIKAQQKLSAGRVQSPAVRLVVERERAIRNFVSTTHFGAVLSFDHPEGWQAEWDTRPFLGEEQEYLLDPELAERAAKVRTLEVLACEDSTQSKNPPSAFTTSGLQQRAQSVLKIRPKQAMALAQKLYEQGVITYMRTDSPNLSEEAYQELAAYAASQNIPLADAQRTWKAKGGSQEAHEAIRPTHFEQTEAGETDDERALYRLIWQQAVASQMPAARYAVRTATLESREPIRGEQKATYTAKGRTLTDSGWKALTQRGDDDDDAEADNPVPALNVGDSVDAVDGKVVRKETKPPARYTLATLVKALERHEIGRPSTYAAILDNITRRGYISEDKKGRLSATPAGETIVDALAGTCTFIDLDYTKDLESALDRIAEGKEGYLDVVGSVHGTLQRELAVLAPAMAAAGAGDHACPECGQPLRYRMGKRGGFWGCSGYPKCKVTLPDADGKPGERQAGGERAPSEAQVNFARDLAKRHDVELPDEAETSSAACSAFIDQYAKGSRKSASRTKRRRPGPRPRA